MCRRMMRAIQEWQHAEWTVVLVLLDELERSLEQVGDGVRLTAQVVNQLRWKL